MTAARHLTCTCGDMHWSVADRAPGTHVVCYCKDCQAFARHLGQTGYLDPAGGTDIFQTTPADISIDLGNHHLACLRLGPKGLRRWYAGCCRTPIANTLPSFGFPFVGMILPQASTGFGKPRAHVQTKTARRPVKEHGFAASGAALMLRGLKAKLSGRGQSPFFDAQGTPIVEATILTREERAAATR